MIPLVLDMKGRKVVVFGGGRVGTRKAAYFAGEADVTVISRSFSPELEAMHVKRVRADLSGEGEDGIRRLVGDAFLVIAATGETDLNDRIGECCRRHGILFNNASGAAGDVILPAVSRMENCLIAVTTFGKSPAFSRYMREMLDRRKDEFGRMILLQERLRAWLLEHEKDQERRSSILWSVISDDKVWDAIRVDPEEGWRFVWRRYLHGGE